MERKRVGWLVAGLGVLALGACAGVGGPATGPADDHCSDPASIVTVDPSTCADTPDGGADYGYTHDGTAADDDDCKYHVVWKSTAIKENTDVMYTVTLTALVDGQPVTGANPQIEAFLADDHPAPNTDITASEGAPGVYTVGPVQYDASGRWTTRFHFFEDCADEPASPHGHAAFFIDVP